MRSQTKQLADMKRLFGISVRHLILGFGAFALCVLSAPQPSFAQTALQQGMRIAAVVNEEAISFLDLETRMVLVIASSRIKDGPQTRRRMAPEILRTLIEERLMQQEALRLELKVTSEEVQARIVSIEQRNGMPPGGLGAFLRQINVPISTLTTRTEAEIAWNKVVRRVLLPKVRIGDDEIDEVIEQIKSNAGKPQYHLAELFLPVLKPSDDAQVRQTAVGLLEQIQKGAPFPQMVRNFSRAPSAATGGDLGWLQTSQIDPEKLRVVRAMKPGQVSLPIRTLGGYYLVLLRNTRTSAGLGRGDAKLKLTQFHISLGKNPTNTERAQKSAQLQDLTNAITTCTQLESVSQKYGSPLSGSLGTVKLSVLPANMRAVLGNLAPGKASPPIATGGGLAVMMICEREDQGLDMEVVRKNVRSRLIGQRMDVAARSYLRDLMREAFVDVRL